MAKKPLYSRGDRVEKLVAAADKKVESASVPIRNARRLRGEICRTAHDLYRPGDTKQTLRAKVLAANAGASSTWMELFEKILDVLLPVLIELLRKLIG